MLKILTKNNTKQTDVKNICPDTIVSNTDKCDNKYIATPTKYVPNTEKFNIKHTITPTKHGARGLFETESKNLTNIHKIYNSDKHKTN